MTGIEAVYQDLALALDLDIWANIFLGREILRTGLLGRLGVLNKPAMRERAAQGLQRTGIRVGSIRTPCRMMMIAGFACATNRKRFLCALCAS